MSQRTSQATALARVCDHPSVFSSTSDSLAFSADHSNSFSCNIGVASASIQYADSLSFTPFGSLAGVFAEGSASASATQIDDENRFENTDASGVGRMSLHFQVIDQPAQFEFNGTADLTVAGPSTAGEIEFSVVGVGIEYRSRIFVAGDTATGPMVLHKTGELQPGYYSVVVTVRAVAAPTYRVAGVPNTASVSMSGVLTLTQEFSGIVVNSTGDAKDKEPGDGLCDTGGPLVNGKPKCTLRAAIMEANATPGLDLITFDIPLSDPRYESATNAFRIRPQPPSVLPEITQPILIDGTTQTGAMATLSTGIRPTIILDGFDLGNGSDEYHGLEISAGDSEVRGLAIINFHGHGISLREKGSNKVQGNFIGIAPGATRIVTGGNHRDGVNINGIAGNLIGGLPLDDRNVISNNGLIGTAAVNVYIRHPGAMHNDIIGNYIGTDDTGLLGLNNTTGVLIDNALGNAVVSNVISGNQIGIRILGEGSQGNQVEGNLIGLGSDGSIAIPNKQVGILIEAASFNTIGGPTAIPGTIPGNVISGNGSGAKPVNGIHILTAAAKHNYIFGNLIGTDQTGKLPRGNSGAGILIEFADSTEVGAPGFLHANVIADNDSGGVVIYTNGNSVIGNFIGTDINGEAALGNKHYGIRIHDGSDNDLYDNLVSGNELGGILIEGTKARRNDLQGNRVGTTSSEMLGLGNKGPGIDIQGAHENRVEESLISANQGSGVALSDSASANVILFNLIGTNGLGTQALPNMAYGIHFHDSPANMADSNTVSGNTLTGIHIQGAKAKSNFVTSNWIGISGNGLNALGNGEDGVFLNNAPDNTVHDNVISANGRYGVFVLGGATPAVVSNNLIGMNYDKSQIMGNQADGIRSQHAERTRIKDNLITASAANGICISNSGTVTQDTLWANTIFQNGDNGVLITGGTQNLLRLNEIYKNGLLGIDLGPGGVTPNDGTDGDTGPNNLQNFPVLQVAFEDTVAGTTTLRGYLKSTPNTTFRIEVFNNFNCDDTKHGEGEIYVDTFTVVTGANGATGFREQFPFVFPGKHITATASDDLGNTSEFSKCVEIEDSGPLVIVNSTGDGGDINPGDGVCSTGGTNSEAQIECTLRAAIQEINAQAGTRKVLFDIPGDGPYTIMPGAPLPPVEGQAVLDATTQSGFAGAPIVEIDGSDAVSADGLTLLGEGVTARGFVINRFDGSGVVLGGTGDHVVELDYIGTDVTGTQERGNQGHGVLVNSANNNRIGSLEAEAANIVAFNNGDGVQVSTGRANSILRNSIHSNGLLGINLLGGSETTGGVTANDDGDGDSGPNDLQNYPILDHVYINGDELEIQGALSGVVGSTYRIEVFGNPACDASGFGEGAGYLGFFDHTLTEGASLFTITLSLGDKSPGVFVTVTATDAGNNTSEFSPCIPVMAAPLTLRLGIFRNPFLSQFLDIFVAASTEVNPQSMVLTVGEESVPMTLTDTAANLWKGDYELTGSSTLAIKVCATSLMGSSGCDSTTVAAGFVSQSATVTLRSADEGLRIRVDGSDVTSDGYILIIPTTDSGGATVTGGALAGYAVSAPNLAQPSAITVEFRFGDLPLPPGTEISQLFIHHLGTGPIVSVVDPSSGMVRATAERPGTYELRVGPVGSDRIADANFLRLDPNYPNPFNASTMIQFELQTRQHVLLTVYDVSGRRITDLIDGIRPAGIQRLQWNAQSESGTGLASGVYFIRLETQHGQAARKVMLIQ